MQSCMRPINLLDVLIFIDSASPRQLRAVDLAVSHRALSHRFEVKFPGNNIEFWETDGALHTGQIISRLTHKPVHVKRLIRNNLLNF